MNAGSLMAWVCSVEGRSAPDTRECLYMMGMTPKMASEEHGEWTSPGGPAVKTPGAFLTGGAWVPPWSGPQGRAVPRKGDLLGTSRGPVARTLELHTQGAWL